MELEWARVLNPDAFAPPWFAETRLDSAKGPYLSSAVRTLYPPQFWGSVHLGLVGSGVRAAVTSLLAFVVAYFSIAVLLFVLTWIYQRSSRVPFFGGMSVGRQYMWSVPGFVLSPTKLWLWGPAWLTVAYVAYMVMPLVMVLAPTTLREARVQPRHIRRITLYSVAPFLFVVALPGLLPGVWYVVDVLLLGRTYSIGGSMFLRNWSWVIRPVAAYVGLLLTWGPACSRYLRVRTPWGHAGALALIAVLMGVGAVFLLHSPLELF
jgi:hypothetical protein